MFLFGFLAENILEATKRQGKRCYQQLEKWEQRAWYPTGNRKHKKGGAGTQRVAALASEKWQTVPPTSGAHHSFEAQHFHCCLYLRPLELREDSM